MFSPLLSSHAHRLTTCTLTWYLGAVVRRVAVPRAGVRGAVPVRIRGQIPAAQPAAKAAGTPPPAAAAAAAAATAAAAAGAAVTQRGRAPAQRNALPCRRRAALPEASVLGARHRRQPGACDLGRLTVPSINQCVMSVRNTATQDAGVSKPAWFVGDMRLMLSGVMLQTNTDSGAATPHSDLGQSPRIVDGTRHQVCLLLGIRGVITAVPGAPTPFSN